MKGEKGCVPGRLRPSRMRPKKEIRALTGSCHGLCRAWFSFLVSLTCPTLKKRKVNGAAGAVTPANNGYWLLPHKLRWRNSSVSVPSLAGLGTAGPTAEPIHAKRPKRTAENGANRWGKRILRRPARLGAGFEWQTANLSPVLASIKVILSKVGSRWKLILK
jgi:hypothetical protein